MQTAKKPKLKWVINVSGYGSFEFEGTEAEAEEMRRHKANWEGGIGTKKLVNNPAMLPSILRSDFFKETGREERYANRLPIPYQEYIKWLEGKLAKQP